MVLDKEAKEDYEFAAKVINETKHHFPNYKVEVVHEPLPPKKWHINF